MSKAGGHFVAVETEFVHNLHEYKLFNNTVIFARQVSHGKRRLVRTRRIYFTKSVLIKLKQGDPGDKNISSG